MASNSRTKKKKLLLKEKLKIIDRIEKGEIPIDIAREIDTHVSNIYRWISKKSEIENWCSKKENEITEKTRMREAENPQLNEAVHIWFQFQRVHGVPISGTLVKTQALVLNQKLNGNKDFLASEGWLHNWKKTYGIRNLTVCGEKLSADVKSVEEFKASFQKTIDEENLTKDQILNCDETGLNFKMRASKTLASKVEKEAPGFKKNKERIAISACTNASGTLKIPLMIVGKSKKPRALKNFNMDNLPVFYRHSKTAWMNTALFKEWYDVQFVPIVTKFLRDKGLPLKCILLIDNAPSHPSETDLQHGELKSKFLPPNTTSLIQPMDQGILENLKRRYWNSLMSSIVNSQEDGIDVLKYLKSINMKNVIFWSAAAWQEVTIDCLRKAWNKILSSTSEDGLSEASTSGSLTHSNPSDSAEELVRLCQRISGYSDVNEEDIRRLEKEDNELPPYPTTDELIAMVRNEEDDKAENSDSSFSENILPEAMRTIDNLQEVISFFEKVNFGSESLKTLYNLQEEAKQICRQHRRLLNKSRRGTVDAEQDKDKRKKLK